MRTICGYDFCDNGIPDCFSMSTYFRSKSKPDGSKYHFSTLNGAHDLIGNTFIFEIVTSEEEDDEGDEGVLIQTSVRAP